jgi:hypothetical protein
MQGRFYFGEILDDDEGCDDQTSAVLNTLHIWKLKNNISNLRGVAISHSDCLTFCQFQLHAGIGEVAAAKARMFVNKPDGSMMFSLDETWNWKPRIHGFVFGHWLSSVCLIDPFISTHVTTY